MNMLTRSMTTACFVVNRMNRRRCQQNQYFLFATSKYYYSYFRKVDSFSFILHFLNQILSLNRKKINFSNNKRKKNALYLLLNQNIYNKIKGR